MSKVLLLDYENDHNYKLIGIHTSLEDFRLAYSLNNLLSISLKRYQEDLDFSSDNNAFYSLYTYDCHNTFTNWSLIANKFNYVSKDQNQPLFSEQQQTNILIKEKRQVDYFLKIEGEFNSYDLSENILKINSIKNIITSYSIDPQTLKSKDFLIF